MELAGELCTSTSVHTGSPRRASKVPLEQRPFIAWDGEGRNLRGPDAPQSYILFGCSASGVSPLKSDGHLHTFDLMDYMLHVAERNPIAIHVGFAFDYDANMIIQSLSVKSLERLHKNGRVTLRRRDGRIYHIQYLAKKWFSVTRRGINYDRKHNPHDKQTVKIYDLFSFFAKSFIAAYEELVGPVPEIVVEGKAARNDFNTKDLDYIEKYWRMEIVMLQELAEELRRRLYGAGLRISQWHGPGALANYAMAQHHMGDAKAVSPEPVREAAKFGYAGGRFEIFHLGRSTGRTIYSLDINSAYPYGISQLPSLANGTWSHVDRTATTVDGRVRIARFGIYRIRLNDPTGSAAFAHRPGPFFHRDRLGNISYPWSLEGWYWSPEVRNLQHVSSDRWEIIEGWEYHTGTGEDSIPDAPFAWVQDMYQQRREWKAKGYGAQLALKLCMNSLYGKMAQRVGWNEEKRLPPRWHQLEWAGWVTSLTRAMLWQVMNQIPFDDLIAVETDGIYTTMNPAELGIEHSTKLGGWEVSEYEEIMYVQSGMAWLRKGDRWTCKRRGLDAKTFALDTCQRYLHILAPGEHWVSYSGETTRFIGLGAALASSADTKSRHCVWETRSREIRPGSNGKRIHVFRQCRACASGHTAYEGMHDMSIRSMAIMPDQRMSKPHDIPWDGDDAAQWRLKELLMGDTDRGNDR